MRARETGIRYISTETQILSNTMREITEHDPLSVRGWGERVDAASGTGATKSLQCFTVKNGLKPVSQRVLMVRGKQSIGY